MSKDDVGVDIILEQLDKIDTKLDIYQKELIELKYNVKTDVEKINLKLETHTKQLENLESYNNRPWKDRLIEMISSGTFYTIGCILGIGIFGIITSTFGTNLTTLIKTLIQNII